MIELSRPVVSGCNLLPTVVLAADAALERPFLRMTSLVPDQVLRFGEGARAESTGLAVRDRAVALGGAASVAWIGHRGVGWESGFRRCSIANTFGYGVDVPRESDQG